MAVLDFFVVCEKIKSFIEKMIIDEDRNYCLSNFAQIRKNKGVIETDHNGLILEFDLQIAQRKPDRVEMFNMKNKLCQEAFKEETENNTELLECFSDNLPVEVQCKKWFKTFNTVLYKCFRKVRIVKNKKNEKSATDNLVRERISLKKELSLNKIDENTIIEKTDTENIIELDPKNNAGTQIRSSLP